MALETFGGVAAALGIVDVSVRLVKTTAELYREFQDAPKEFQRLRSQLGVLEDLMVQLGGLKTDDVIPLAERASLRRVLLEVESCLNAIKAEYCRLRHASGKLSSLRWTLFDRDTAAKLEKRLESSQQQLVTMIVMKSFPLQHEIQSKMTLVLRKIEAVEVGRPVPRQQSHPTSTTPRIQHPTFQAPVPCRKSQPSQTFIEQVPGWLTLLGLHNTVVKIQRPHAKIIRLSARLQVPGRRGRERVAFLIDLTFHLASRFFFAYPSFGVCTIVPSDSPIVKACQRGNLSKVQQLFAAGTASPRDVTPDNLTLLSHAVNNGSAELVEFLLEQGADVNSPYGKSQTSPLQWALYQRKLDITRLLVTYDAQGDYVSSLGWTPVFYLLNSLPEGKVQEDAVRRLDFLGVLAANRVFLDLEVSDPGGSTILQKVVASGTGEEVSTLLALGALASRTGPLPWRNEWSLMHEAISSDNVSTFEALLGHDCFKNVEDLDYFGWTMLHHAAHLGHGRIVGCLLQRGAEEFVPNYHLDGESGDREDEDQNVAEEEDGQMSEYFSRCRWTREKYFAYMQALLVHRRIELHSVSEDGTTVDEIYWEANERPGRFDSS